MTDLLQREKGEAGRSLRQNIDAGQFAFVGRRLYEDYLTWELSPYLAAHGVPDSLGIRDTPPPQLKGWKLRISSIGQDRVQAEHFSRAVLAVTRLRYTIWYAAEAKRYVMLRHQTWNHSGGVAADEIVRLEEYRLK